MGSMRPPTRYGIRNAPDIAAVFQISCPCDSCPNSDKCAHLKLACSDFQNFVQTGQNRKEGRKPSANRYDLLFPEEYQ